MAEMSTLTSFFHQRLPLTADQTHSTEIDSDENDQYGLDWTDEMFSIEPAWTIEPNLDVITQLCTQFINQHLSSNQLATIQVEKLAEGAFNKVFTVKTQIQTLATPEQQAKYGYAGYTESYVYVFRASLPVNPRRKTLCEYATLEFLKDNTTIPTARVLAINTSTIIHNNPLRFEWMIQTLMPGSSLEDMWTRLDDAKRQNIVSQLVNYHVELFNLQREGIGGLYTIDEQGCGFQPQEKIDGHSFRLDQVGTIPFFQGDRFKVKSVSHGPFRSARDWLEAQLRLVQLECLRDLEYAAAEKQDLVAKIRHLKDSLKPVTQATSSEKLPESMIDPENEHNVDEQCGTDRTDVSDHKIKDSDSDEDATKSNDSNSNDTNKNKENLEDIEKDLRYLEGQIKTSESISILIGRLLSSLPKFFPISSNGSAEPSVLCHQDMSRRNILVDAEGNITAILDWENIAFLPTWAACNIPSFLDDKPYYTLPDPKNYYRGKDELSYKENFLRYELMGLRENFLSQMKVKCPQWMQVYEQSEALRDLLRAVDVCDHVLAKGRIRKWLDGLEGSGFQLIGDTYTPLDLY